jgi:hypothetical protein
MYTDKTQIMLLEVPKRIVVDSKIIYRGKIQEILQDGSLGEVKIFDFTEEILMGMLSEVEMEEKRRETNRAYV